MKNSNRINQIKSLKAWTSTNFHGNTKKVGELAVTEIIEIVSKKKARELEKMDNSVKTPIQITRSLITLSKKTKGTPYFKILIEGNTGIYYASPIYGHEDYNKSRLFDKNEIGLKLMNIFNAIVK